MKKIVSMLLVLTVVFAAACIFTVPASAATKAEIIEEFKKIIPQKYHESLVVAAENALANMDMTSAQGDEILAKMQDCKDYVGIIDSDNAYDYTSDERKFVLERIEESIELLGYELEITPPTNPDDIIKDYTFTIVDPGTGTTVFEHEYEVTDTSTAGFDYTILILAGAVCLFAAAGTVYFTVSKKQLA